MWNKTSIIDLLDRNPRAVERALVVIYNNQTAEEKSCEATMLNNGVGFSGCDAHSGTYYAKWVLSGRHLSGKHLDKARRIAKRYHRQLLAEIEAKAA